MATASASRLAITYFTDPGCPWAYSASPALTVLRWRYADQLSWRLTTVGLAEDPRRYVERGYTPAGSAQGYRRFRRYGMPFATDPRARIPATSPACRAIVATRRIAPGLVWHVLRELQFGWFTTPLVMDEQASMRTCLTHVDGLDVNAVMAAIDEPEVQQEYRADKAAARSAQGSPTAFQNKAANTDGLLRYTAPTLLMTRDGDSLEAGGFQPVEAYDVIVANLDPTLDRRPAAERPDAALAEFTHGLTTMEVAAVMAPNNQAPDRESAEDGLITLVAEGRVHRRALGDDALWTARTG